MVNFFVLRSKVRGLPQGDHRHEVARVLGEQRVRGSVSNCSVWTVQLVNARRPWLLTVVAGKKHTIFRTYGILGWVTTLLRISAITLDGITRWAGTAQERGAG